MHTLLGWLQAAATRRPAVVLAALGAITIGLASLASTIDLEVDLTAFGREDSAAVQAMERVRSEFGDPTATVQVMVDAGPGGNILTPAGLDAVRTVESITIEALGGDAHIGPGGVPDVQSVARAVDGTRVPEGAESGEARDGEIGTTAALLVNANPQLAALVSEDFDPSSATARATVLVARLDAGLTEDQRTEAAKRVRAALSDAEVDAAATGVDLSVFSTGLFASGLVDAVRAEAPLLFGLALLVVLVVLTLLYRSVFDVALGFAGLLGTVVWTFGFIALLGPGYLGWTGPPSQLAVIVPVLLVGLGIDYSVHLTARYREARAAGQVPPAATGYALRRVGAALVLATVATATGFAANGTAPVQMVADFGVFVAVGVICAFTVMTLLVPSAWILRGRHAEDGDRNVLRELRLPWLMVAPAALARRRPAAGLGVAAILVAGSLLAATAIDTRFDRDDFVPEGSDVARLLVHQQELFGKGLSESTFVIIDGDFTDPALANAIWETQARLTDVDGVRANGGQPQVRSVIAMASALSDPRGQADRPSDPDVGGTGSGVPRPLVSALVPPFAADDDLASLYRGLREANGDEQVDQLLAPDARTGLVQIRTTVGDADALRLHRDVRDAFESVAQAGASVTVTSDPIIMAEMSRELSRFQARAIALTLLVVLALLVGYYTLSARRGLLGVIAMIPAAVSASLILGTMWVLGTDFNAVTATLTALAVGIGVPYGIHVVNRFAEDLEVGSIPQAIDRTLNGTGAALAGSALTTFGAFVVLAFSSLPPMRSLGLLGAAGIAFALWAALLVEPGALALWARRRARP